MTTTDTGRTMDKMIAEALDSIAPWAIEAIRTDERRRLAALLTENAETLGKFAKDGPASVNLIAYMIGIESSTSPDVT